MMPRPGLLAAVAIAGVLPAVALRAAPTDDEKKQMDGVRQAYAEGAFAVADKRATALLKAFPKSELTAQAQLVQAQALYQLGRDDAALAALALPPDQVAPDLRPDYLYWQGEAALDAGNWTLAEQKYRAVLALKGADTDQASLGLAWALFKQGRQTEAQPLLDVLAKSPGDPAISLEARLIEAKIALAQPDIPGATAALESLRAASPPPRLQYQIDYWLGEAYAAAGKPDQAAAAYLRVTGAPDAFPKTLVALAYLGLGRAQYALKQYDLAGPSFQKAYQLADNETDRLNAFRASLDSARDAGHLPEAIAALQEFVKTSDASAPAALFAIGSALADAGSSDKAIGMIESLLVAYPQSPWIPAANDELGQLYLRTGRPDLAVAALQNGLAGTTDPALVRTARFQLGTALLQQKDYAGAVAQFAAISPGADAMAEDASYNLLLAQAQLGKPDVYLKTEADFEKRFPKSAHLSSLALATGRMLADAGKPDDAKVALENGVDGGGDPADHAALLRALEELQYQTGDLAGALKTCQAIVAQYPNDSLDAAQRAILISFELKKLTDDQVEQALSALAQKSGASPGAASAYFRLGEFYSFRGNSVKAQDAFQQLVTAFPQSDLADQALFYGGRAAFAHQDYAAASALLAKVPDNSPLKSEARLWQGRTAQEQNNFATAIGFYEGVLAVEKSGPRFAEANLLKGECLFEEASKDPTLYPQAVTAFDAVRQGTDGTPAQRNEAAVRAAKALEKMGRTDDAMALYLDVLYGRVAGDDAAGDPDFSWQIKAGWEAGRLRESEKDWRGAIEVYQRLEQIGGAHRDEFHDLVNKLRRDNYIYE
jgi:TolA-binding protein